MQNRMRGWDFNSNQLGASWILGLMMMQDPSRAGVEPVTGAGPVRARH